MVINLKNSTKLAVCSLSTALGVLILFLGGITMVLAYAAPMFLGIIMIMLKRTFGTKSAWITFIATSLLSFILVTDKECMMMYVIFFGYIILTIGRLLCSCQPGHKTSQKESKDFVFHNN